jgi:Sugar-transfer associated ATP-grasp
MGLKSKAILPFRLARYLAHWLRDARPAAREYHTSMLRILKEQVRLKMQNDLRPDEYYYYGLADPNMPWEQKLTYLGQKRLRRDWNLFVPPRYRFCFHNKLVFKHWFRSMGMPVAPLYGTFHPHWGRSEEGLPLRNAEELAAWMAATDVREPVFKPVESAEGQMVLVMGGRKENDPTRFVDLQGKDHTPEQLVSHMTDPAKLKRAYPEHPVPVKTFLIEERLHQHPTITALASETLCCARMVTMTTLGERVELFESALKIDMDSSGVDNTSRGAASAWIDPETGKLGAGLLEKHGDWKNTINRFPGKDCDFTGVQLPFWKEAVELVKTAATMFPEAHAIGWDVAFTENGPYLVEGNAAWGTFHENYGKGVMYGIYKEVLEQILAKTHTQKLRR